MNILGKSVTLRAVEKEDLLLLNKWSNDPEIWNMLGGWHFPYSMDCTEKWFSQINNNDANYQIFAIDTKEHGLIGTANLINIDWKNKNSFHGIMIGNTGARGKGYAQDAVLAISRYAFNELGLNRLDGNMIDYNEKSISFYIKKCGWVIEGRKKGWFFRNGKFHDQVVVGITRDDYENFIKTTNYWDS